MFDPVIQRHMTHFFDVHGNLHITIKPELIKALGWAVPKIGGDDAPYLADHTPVCLDINYSGEYGEYDSNCDIVIKAKHKALGENMSYDAQRDSY